MIQDVTSLYADLVKAALLQSSPAVLTVPVKEKQGVWHSPMDGMGAWLPSCVRYVRYVTSLNAVKLTLLLTLGRSQQEQDSTW